MHKCRLGSLLVYSFASELKDRYHKTNHQTNMKFGINNFRVFDKEGSTFEVKPITLLTGANSSGKSSMTKALLLLEDFLSQYAEKKQIGQCVLNFSSDRFRLGNYSNALNRKANADDSIVFSYVKHSDFLNLDAKVSFSFKSNPNDQEGKGHFDNCKIESLEGVRLFTIRMKEIYGYESIEIEPSCNVNVTYLRKLYFDRYRLNIGKDETHGIYYTTYDDFLNDGNLFWNENAKIISEQIALNTLFLFDFKELESFSKSKICSTFDSYGELKEYLPQITKAFEESGETDFATFFSSLEEKSQLNYEGRFPLNGSLTPFEDYSRTRTGDVLDIIAGPEMGSHSEYRKLVYDNHAPFIFILGVASFIISQYTLFSEIAGPGNDFSKLENSLRPFKVFVGFLQKTIEELLSPRFVNHIQFVPSDKVSVRRLYDFGNDQDSFHKLLKLYLSVKSDYLTRGAGNHYKPYPKAPSFSPGDFINKWISSFEISSRLQIETPAEGLGIILRLFSGKSDKVGHLLADEGYGISQLVSLLLSLEICIMKGYLDKTFRPRYIIIVEEPEIHLHPKFQSLLADLFWSALYDYRISCIVETHSEYLIRKMQVLAAAYAKKESLTDKEMKDKCPIAVYYFPKDKHPYEMEMRNDGMFINDFGAGFFDEAAKLHLQILYSPTK